MSCNKNIIIFCVILFIGCTKQNNETNKYSDSFSSFVNEFKVWDTPLTFDINTNFTSYSIKNEEGSKKYLYDLVNIDYAGLSTKQLSMSYICRLPDDKSKKYIVVIYCVNFFGQNRQIIMATFSKKNESRISQLVLAGDNYRTYQISSEINKVGEITSKYIQSSRFTSNPPYKSNPGFFFVQEKETKYKIDDEGCFTELSYKESNIQLSVKDGFKYIYPVQAPNERCEMILKMEYDNPKLDSNSFSKPPKGYKLLK